MPSGTITVGVASQQYLPANAGLSKVLLQNLSANSVWFNFGGPAVAGQGLLIPPAPSLPIQLDAYHFDSVLRLSWNAIASAANSTVYYIYT